MNIFLLEDRCGLLQIALTRLALCLQGLVRSQVAVLCCSWCWCQWRGWTTAIKKLEDVGYSFNILMLNPEPWTTHPAIQWLTQLPQSAHEKES